MSRHTLYMRYFPGWQSIPAHDNQAHCISLKDTLSDRNFVLAGLFFGTLNCSLGYSFGLPYSNEPAIISVLFGIFSSDLLGAWGFSEFMVSLSLSASFLTY